MLNFVSANVDLFLTIRVEQCLCSGIYEGLGWLPVRYLGRTMNFVGKARLDKVRLIRLG
jgi:hypothetical protein